MAVPERYLRVGGAAARRSFEDRRAWRRVLHRPRLDAGLAAVAYLQAAAPGSHQFHCPVQPGRLCHPSDGGPSLAGHPPRNKRDTADRPVAPYQDAERLGVPLAELENAWALAPHDSSLRMPIAMTMQTCETRVGCTRTDADLIAHQDAVAVCCTVSSCPRPTGQRSANTDDRGNAHPYTNSCLRVPSPDQPQAT